MGVDSPNPDAYGRVTHPERFSLVVEAAEEMIGRLAERYDVERLAGSASADFPGWSRGEHPTVRLVPRVGAPLSFLFTDFPGVVVKFGDWGEQAFPACGCDACDDRPEDLVVQMRQAVEAVVSGTVEGVPATRRLSLSLRGRQSHGLLRKTRLSQRNRPRNLNPWPP